MKAHRSSRGFTIVEIMIVVAMIALLATMALPTFMRVRATSQEKTILNNLRQLNSAAQQYFMEYGALSVEYASLVGSDKYIRFIKIVAQENYPTTLYQTDTSITATGSSIPNKPDISYGN